MTVLDGEKSEVDGGKRGRGGANKVPFVVAVETTAEGRPLRVLLHLVERHDSAAIETRAREHIVAGTHVVSDENLQVRVSPCSNAFFIGRTEIGAVEGSS